MAPHIDKLTYEVMQAELRKQGRAISPHADSTAEASVKTTPGGKELYVSLFSTGTIRVSPPGSKECEELRDEIRRDLEQLQKSAQEVLGREAFEFLDEPDRESLLVSRSLCCNSLKLIDYSAFVMPLAKAFEGFAKKVLIRLGAGDPLRINDPNFFRDAFESCAYKSLLSNAADKKVLERLRGELPFSRHGLMHSPPQPAFIMRDRAAALAKEGDILTLMRETATHFKGRI